MTDSLSVVLEGEKEAEETQAFQNPAAHMRWTGPQLLEQLPQINIFCMGMGSAGQYISPGLCYAL